MKNKEISVNMSYLAPSNFDNALKMCEFITKSGVCPEAYRNKPADALIAIEMGHELGIKPIQSLQNIATINGKPSVWGDMLLAIAQNHPKFVSIKEESDGKIATCTVVRRGMDPVVREFSIEDATKAGLLNRPVWKTYPKRMLQMRARGFAIRDAFADALRGVSVAEEQEDLSYYDAIQDQQNKEYVVKNAGEKVNAIADALASKASLINIEDNPIAEDVSADDFFKESDEKEKVQIISDINYLLDNNNISSDVVNALLKKAGTDSFDQMDFDKVQKSLKYLKGKI